MLLLAEVPTAGTLLIPIGYLQAVVTQEQLDEEVTRLCDRLG